MRWPCIRAGSPSGPSDPQAYGECFQIPNVSKFHWFPSGSGVRSAVLVDLVSTCLPGMVSLLTQFLLVFQGLGVTMQWGTSRPGARSTGMLADHVVLVLCFITPDEWRNSLPETLAVVDGVLEVLSQALRRRGCRKADSAEGRAIRAVMCQLSADSHYYLYLYVYSRV